MGALLEEWKKKNRDKTEESGSLLEEWRTGKKYGSVDTSGVNDAYFEAYNQAANNFFSDKELREDSYDRWQGLTKQADTIRAWAWQNRDKLGSNYDAIMSATDLSEAGKYWGQFGSAEDYAKVYGDYVSYKESDSYLYDNIVNSADYKTKSASGWKKYVSDRDARNKVAVRGEEEESFWDMLGRWMGSGGPSDSTLPLSGVTQVQNAVRDNPIKREPGQDWSDQQRAIFGYLYDTDPAKAEEYAAYADLENEYAAIANIQNKASANIGAGILHSLGALAASPLGLADVLNDLALGEVSTGTDGSVSPFEYSQAVMSGITERLNKESGTVPDAVPIIGGKGLGDVYGLGMNVAQSTLSAYTLGSAGTLVSYFGQGAASAMKEAKARGASDAQATVYGVAAGVFEGLAEKIGVDNLFKLGGTDTLKGLVVNVLKQAGAEGTEEGLTSLLTNIADNVILQENSAFYELVDQYVESGMTEREAKKRAWIELAEGIAYDTIAGAASGGISGGGYTIGTSIIENKTYKNTYGHSQSELVAEGLELDPQSAYFKRLEQKLGKGKDLSGSELRGAVTRNERMISKQQTDATDGAEVAEQEQGTAKEAAEQTAKNAPKIAQERTESTEAQTVTERENAPVAKETAAQAEGIRETSQENVQTLLAEYSKGYGAQAKAMVATYLDGQDVAEYDAAFRQVYDMGASGVSYSFVEGSKSYLTDSQKKIAYEAGKASQDAKATAREQEVAKQATGGTKRKKGVVRGKGVSLKELMAKFNDTQREAYKIMSTIAEITGINIVLYKSKADLQGNFKGAQGMYKKDSDPGTLYIDVNAGLNNIKSAGDLANYTMLRTFSHEFVHFIENYNPVWYNELRRAVFDHIENADELISREAAESGLDYESASREVVAEALTDILPDSSFLEDLANNHKNIFEKLYAKFKEFAANIKKHFASLSPNANKAAQTLKQSGKYAEEIVKLFDKAAAGAVENYQDTVAEQQAEPVKQEVKAKPKEKSLYEKYSEIKEQHPDSIVLYRVGDFYEILGEDAKVASKAADLTLAGRSDVAGGRVAMVGFPFHALDRYAEKLRKVSRVAIVEADGNVIEMAKAEAQQIDQAKPKKAKKPKKIASKEAVIPEESADAAQVEQESTQTDVTVEQAKNNLKKAITMPVQGTNEEALLAGIISKELTFEMVSYHGNFPGFSPVQRAHLVQKLIEGVYTDDKVIKIDVPYDGKFEINNTPENVANVLNALKVRVPQEIVWDKKEFTHFKNESRVAVMKHGGQDYITDGGLMLPITDAAAKIATKDLRADFREYPEGFDEIVANATVPVTNAPYESEIEGRAVYVFDIGGEKVYFDKKRFAFIDGGVLTYAKGKRFSVIKSVNEDGSLIGYLINVRSPKTDIEDGKPTKLKSFSKKKGAKGDVQYQKRGADDYSRIYDMQVEVNQLRKSIQEFEASEDFKLQMSRLSEAIANDDIDAGAKAYQKWRTESGYDDLISRRDNLQMELDILQKSYEENLTNKAVEEEKAAIEKSGLSEADYFRKQAVKEFGYTPYFYDAGYITPNGKMLNFSGEKGYHYGGRGQDHRAIGTIYADTEGSDALNRFVKDGNIRIMAESPGIDISTIAEPTKEQYATIKKFAYEYANKEFFNVDFTDENGRVIGSLQYEGRINPERIINDIKHYYATGEIRDQSVFDRFRYQRRDGRMTDQEVLAYAVDLYKSDETIAEGLTEAEKGALGVFEKRLGKLDGLIAERAEQGQIYRDNTFQKGGDRALAEAAHNRMELLDGQIARASAQLLDVQEKTVLQGVLQKARKVVEQQERARGDEKLKRWRDRRENAAQIKKYRDRIEADYKDLVDWLNHPLNKDVTKHVNENIKGIVIPFLLTFDFTSQRQLRGGEATKADKAHVKQAQKLLAMLDGLDEDVRYSGEYDFPLNFSERLAKHVETVKSLMDAYEGEMVINRMTAEELRDLCLLMANLKTAITTLNKFHTNAMFAHVSAAGDTTIRELKALKDYDGNAVDTFLFWKNIRPDYAWDRFGSGGRSINLALREGQSKLAWNAKAIIDYAQSTFTAKEREEWENKVLEVSISDGRKVKTTVAALMSFYELSKRAQGRKHILDGGVTVSDVEIRESKLSKKKRVSGRYGRFTEADIEAMNAALTDRQREVADKLQQFMEKQGGEWGNHVTMARFGERAFGEKGYFPISVDKQSLSTNTDKQIKGADLYRLLNMGFTKELSENTKQPLLLYSIFDVFSTHMADMAQYNAMALPVLDAIRWLNYKEYDLDTGAEKNNLRAQMKSAFGSPVVQGRQSVGYAESFVLHILQAYNGTEAQGTPGDSLGMKMLHTYNRAQIAFNVRVVVQQPMALTRAAMILDPKYIAKALDPKKLKSNVEDMLSHSGIAAWKDLGYYDINISRGLAQMIKQDSTFTEKVTEVGLKPAEWADKATWGVIWAACKMQLKAQGVTDYVKIEQLFDDVIYKTQVVDSVLTKSEYMRDKGFFARSTASFMSEPTATASMMLDAYDQYRMDIRRGMSAKQAWAVHKRSIGRTVLVYSVGAIMLAAVQAAADGLRDDDDYQNIAEKWDEAFWSNLLDELSPLNKLPLVSTIWELIKVGLDTFTNLDVYGNPPSAAWAQWFDTLAKAWEITMELANGETNYTWYAAIYKYLQVASGLTGMPFAAATREVVTIWNNSVGAFAPSLKIKTYELKEESEIKYAVLDGYLTEGEAADELLDKGIVYDREEAELTAELWAYIADHKEYSDLTVSAYSLYKENCKGVDMGYFYQAWKYYNQSEADRDKDGEPIAGTKKRKVLDFIYQMRIPASDKKKIIKCFYK